MPFPCTVCRKTVRRNLMSYVTSHHPRLHRRVTLLRLLPSPASVVTITMDFELATWRAVNKLLPDVRRRGCLFHLTQAIWRKCQEIGLQNAYLKKERVKTFIRKLMALPFLPATSITNMFDQIEARVPVGGKLERLVAYYRRQWIHHCTFQPVTWCMFNVAVRTNNHVEGWHRRLNSKCRERTLGMYRLIPLLADEGKLLPIQMRLVQDRKLTSYIRKRASERQEEIFSLWRLLKRGNLSASEMLSRVSQIHGPVV